MSRATASAGILSDRIRRIVIEQSKRANVGHIGSSLSVADILGTLYSGVLQGAGPDDPERDRFVLSKGHAGLALYAALHEDHPATKHPDPPPPHSLQSRFRHDL